MAKLIYSPITSVDAYVADENGRFDWAVPDDEVHAFINDLERPVGTYLYGRRMYEVMVAWEAVHTLPDQAPLMLEFAAIWRAADKIVYSGTLEEVVDEYHLFLVPILVGGGTKALADCTLVPLELVDECRFGNGVVHLHYAART